MSENETWSDDGLVCPYCGHTHEPADTDYLIYDESMTEWECDSCGSEFRASVMVSHTWTGEKIAETYSEEGRHE